MGAEDVLHAIRSAKGPWAGSSARREILARPWETVAHAATGAEGVRERTAHQLEDHGATETRIAGDYSDRYAIELLQNAQDANADRKKMGGAWFRTTDTALIVANEGTPFDTARLTSLTRLGGSSKSRADGTHQTIGYKGIGFSSVFQMTRQPQILSDGLAFGFDRERARLALTELLGQEISRIPARYFPFLLNPEEWVDDRAVVDDLFAEGAVTVVRLPYRSGFSIDEAQAALSGAMNSTTLLMMPHLRNLDVDGKVWTKRKGKKWLDGQVSHVRSSEGDAESWFLRSSSAPIAAEVVAALDEEVWKDVRSVSATIGVPWADGTIDEGRGVSPVHVFFPTEDTTGRSLLVHGDFFLESNRRHVQDSGPGGVVSGAVAALVADLTASTVKDWVKAEPSDAKPLLAVLTPTGKPQGFGSRLNELIDEVLEDLPFVPVTQGRPRPPSESSVFSCDVEAVAVRDLAKLLRPTTHLAVLGLPKVQRDYLEKLDAYEVDASSLLETFKPHRGVPYDRTVEAVQRLVANVPTWARPDLRSTPFLQSTAGVWTAPKNLYRPIEGVPTLPAGLEVGTYKPPRSAAAEAFIDANCAPRELTLQAALDVVLDAVSVGTYGQNGEEVDAVLQFLRKVWREDGDVVRKHPKRGDVRLPSRGWTRNSKSTLSKASELYFTEDWLGNRNLEIVLGRIRARFLAVVPPKRGIRDRRDFFAALGVADSPRLTPVQSWNAPYDWRELVDEHDPCPDTHTGSARPIECSAITRLAELLDGVDQRTGHALAAVLPRSPYGKSARISCAHSAHRSSPNHNETIGLQRWLLTRSEWVPVDDPFGADVLQPNLAWTDVNGTALKSVLATSRLRKGDGARFGLPAATSPTPEQVHATLLRIALKVPDLADASEVQQKGVLQLLKKLEQSLRGLRREVELEGPLPAWNGGELTWHDAPMIADVDHPSELPLAVLPPGQWSGLRAARGLDTLSSVLRRTVRTVGAAPSTGDALSLSPKDLPCFLAFVHARGGANLKEAAHLIGRLRIRSAEQILVSWSVPDSDYTFDDSLPAFIEDTEDGPAVLTVRLSLVAKDLAALAGAVSRYLRLRSPDDLILYFSVGTKVQEIHGLDADQLEEAREALEKYLHLDADDDQSPGGRDRPAAGEAAKVDSKAEPAAEAVSPAGTARDGATSTSQQPAPVAGAVRVAWRAEPVEDEPIGEITFGEPGPGAGRPQPEGRRPSGARGGSGARGFPTVSPAERKSIEMRAIGVAEEFAMERLGCIEVRDVQTDNKGWDLEFVFGDGDWWPVEVKGSGGGLDSFIVTRNEREAALEEGNYRFVLVNGTSGLDGSLLLVRPGDWLANEDLEPMSWVIRDWGEPELPQHPWSATGVVAKA